MKLTMGILAGTCARLASSTGVSARTNRCDGSLHPYPSPTHSPERSVSGEWHPGSLTPDWWKAYAIPCPIASGTRAAHAVGPVGPVGPVSPVGPVGPVVPVGPVGAVGALDLLGPQATRTATPAATTAIRALMIPPFSPSSRPCLGYRRSLDHQRQKQVPPPPPLGPGVGSIVDPVANTVPSIPMLTLPQVSGPRSSVVPHDSPAGVRTSTSMTQGFPRPLF